MDFDKLSPQELVAAESAVLTMRSLLEAVRTAPHGHGIECVESVIHDKGFEHLRTMLQTAAASHAGAQKRRSVISPVPAGKRPRSNDVTPSKSRAASGTSASRGCITPADITGPSTRRGKTWAGIIGSHRITPHARRMIVLAGSGCSFEEAARNLVELSHVQVANDLVRVVCDAKGKAVRQWMNQSPEPKKVFDQAQGVVAFSTDGIKPALHGLTEREKSS